LIVRLGKTSLEMILHRQMLHCCSRLPVWRSGFDLTWPVSCRSVQILAQLVSRRRFEHNTQLSASSSVFSAWLTTSKASSSVQKQSKWRAFASIPVFVLSCEHCARNLANRMMNSNDSNLMPCLVPQRISPKSISKPNAPGTAYCGDWRDRSWQSGQSRWGKRNNSAFNVLTFCLKKCSAKGSKEISCFRWLPCLLTLRFWHQDQDHARPIEFPIDSDIISKCTDCSCLVKRGVARGHRRFVACLERIEQPRRSAAATAIAIATAPIG
jgi:hypothetical protein